MSSAPNASNTRLGSRWTIILRMAAWPCLLATSLPHRSGIPQRRRRLVQGVGPFQLQRDGPQRGFRCWASAIAMHGFTWLGSSFRTGVVRPARQFASTERTGGRHGLGARAADIGSGWVHINLECPGVTGREQATAVHHLPVSEVHLIDRSAFWNAADTCRDFHLFPRFEPSGTLIPLTASPGLPRRGCHCGIGRTGPRIGCNRDGPPQPGNRSPGMVGQAASHSASSLPPTGHERCKRPEAVQVRCSRQTRVPPSCGSPAGIQEQPASGQMKRGAKWAGARRRRPGRYGAACPELVNEMIRAAAHECGIAAPSVEPTLGPADACRGRTLCSGGYFLARCVSSRMHGLLL